MFRLLHLPLVPIKEVMEMMDASELLSLSSCNGKLRAMAESTPQVKSFFYLSFEQKWAMNCADIFQLLHLHSDYSKFLRVNPIFFNVSIGSRLGIEIRLKDDRVLKWLIYSEFIGDVEKNHGKLYFIKIEEVMVPGILKEKGELVTFWNDRLEGFKTILGYLIRKFRIRVDSLTIEKGNHQEFSMELKSIINFINYRQNCYGNVKIDERRGLLTLKDLDFLNKNVTAFSKFSRLGERTIESVPERVIEAKHLLISYAYWFRLDHLQMTNCVFVNIVNTCIDNQDMSDLVKHWIFGRFPRLRHIKIKGRDVKIGRILEPSIRRFGYIRNAYYKLENEEQVHIGVGVVIRPNDQAATVIYPRNRLKRLKTFEMVVWPDFDGFNYDRNAVFLI